MSAPVKIEGAAVANVPPAELDIFPSTHPFEWVRDDHCRAATPDEYATRRCRRPKCGRPPVMAMLRSRGHWWLYCDHHTYGRRINKGVVEHRRWLPEEETS